MVAPNSKADLASMLGSLAWFPVAGARWPHRIDPGAHRRIKGLRLVTAFGIAAMLGARVEIVRGLPNGAALNSIAGGFALWASVSEGRATRAESSRDLLLLSTAAALGAASFIFLAPLLQHFGHAGPELTLVMAPSWWAIYGDLGSPAPVLVRRSTSANYLPTVPASVPSICRWLLSPDFSLPWPLSCPVC